MMDDEYTIADISMLGWVRNLIGFYGARELVGFDSLNMSRRGWSAAWRGRRCSAGSIFQPAKGRAAWTDFGPTPPPSDPRPSAARPVLTAANRTITGPAVALACPITSGPRLSSMKASARRFDLPALRRQC